MKTPFRIRSSALSASFLLTLLMIKMVADHAYPAPGSPLHAARIEAARMR